MALAAFEALTAAIEVRCEAVEQDRHGRLVAKAFSANGVDISRRLVSAGWALAKRRSRAQWENLALSVNYFTLGDRHAPISFQRACLSLRWPPAHMASIDDTSIKRNGS
jgi:hypothetical protein